MQIEVAADILLRRLGHAMPFIHSFIYSVKQLTDRNGNYDDDGDDAYQ